MNRQPIGRRIAATCLAMLVLGMTAISPLLDARENDRGTHVEREHDPSCRVLHDHHTVCSQLAKTFGRDAPATVSVARPDVAVWRGPVLDPALPPHRSHIPSPSPRGPPIPLA